MIGGGKDYGNRVEGGEERLHGLPSRPAVETVADAPQQTDTAEDVDDVVDASSRDVSVRGGENCYGAGGRCRWG